MKRTIRKFLAVGLLSAALLLTAVLLTVNPTAKTASAASPFAFTKVGNTHYSISVVDTSIKRAIIPEEYDNLPVTEIGFNGFAFCYDLVDVYIPDSITKISDNAFIACDSLKAVNMTKVETIGANAFSMCDSLEVIVIPNTVTFVGANFLRLSSPDVYTGASYIKTTAWIDWLLNYTGNNVIYDHSSIIYREIKDNSNNTTAYSVRIASSVNEPNATLELDYHNGLDIIKIEAGAFRNCTLNALSIGLNSSHEIIVQSSAFMQSNINSILLNDNVVFWDEDNGVYDPPQNIFSMSTAQEVILQDELTEIFPAMFYKCYDLGTVSFSSSLLGYNALSSNIEEIGTQAFFDCTSLQYIFIPSSVEYARAEIFKGWTSNQTVELAYTEIEVNALIALEKWHPNWNGGNANIKYKTYKITYFDKGGASFSGKHEVGYPTKHIPGTQTNLKSASKTGYDFDGWFDNINCNGSPIEELAANGYINDIKLYALWTAKTYNITYFDRYGEPFSGVHNVIPPPSKHTYDTVTNLNGASKAGYVFKGWYDNINCSGEPIDYLSAKGYTDHIKLYAKWIPEWLDTYEDIYEFDSGLWLYELMEGPREFVILSECGGWYDLFVTTRGGDVVSVLAFDASTSQMQLVYDFEDGQVIEEIYLEQGVYYVIIIESDDYGWALVFDLAII